MTKASTQIGSFQILDLLGEGAMGRVYRARYAAQDIEVALKLLSKHRPASELQDFRREVQAMAGLDHPGVAHIYDYGTVTESEAWQDELLGAGTPWIAMELGVGHTLESAPLAYEWPVVKRALLEILDALAHAHARQIVHRDLKPGNVLVASDAGGLKLLLADFGIAHVWNSRKISKTGDVATPSAGTPYYMSPEQLHGRWRDYGAWTDLYAFGCMAFEFVCGAPPYDGESVLELAMQHISAPIPSLDPAFEIPVGLESWFRRLLAKPTLARFQSAAEAAWFLTQLEGRDYWPARLRESSFQVSLQTNDTSETESIDPRGATLGFSATEVLSQTELAMAIADDRVAHGEGVTQAERGVFRPHRGAPFPLSWRAPRPIKPQQLQGAGEALVGLREVRFVDRDAERDAIWEALRIAHDERLPTVVTVESPAGLGKSRLVEWTTRRAHELGVGPTIRVSGSRVGSADEPLIQIVEEMFRLNGMSRRRAYERMLEILEATEANMPDDAEIQWDREYHAAALTNLIRPLIDDDPTDSVPRIAFERQAQKFDLLTRFLFAYTRQQTATLWCDDAHYGHVMLGYAEWLRDNYICDFPLMIVLSYRADVLAERPLEAAAFAATERLQRLTWLELERLPRDAQASMIRHTLSLAPELAEKVTDVTAGDPFFATQLLESWVSDDALTPSAAGFRLRDDAYFPGDVESLADHRIERFVELFDEPDVARTILEVVAAIERPVDAAVLERLAIRLDVAVPEQLVDRLVALGIGRRVRNGWGFDEGIFRDRVEARARQRGSWRRVHLACAEDLRAMARPDADERIAQHLLAAGNAREALEPLLQSLDRKVLESSYVEAIALADRVLKTCHSLGIGLTADAYAHAVIRRAEALRFYGRFEESFDDIDRLRGHVDALDPSWAAELYRVEAGIYLMEARVDDTLRCYGEARRRFEQAGDLRGLSQVRHGEGYLLTTLGRWNEAAAALGDALEAARRVDAQREIGWAEHAFAELEMRRDPSEGRRHAEAALEVFRGIGTQSGIALCYRIMGDCCRIAGDLETAWQSYEATIDVAGQIRSVHGMFGRLGKALVKVEQGLFDDAAKWLEEVEERSWNIPALFEPIPYLTDLLIRANLNDVAGFDARAEQIEPMTNVGALAHPDLVTLPEKAGDALWARGEIERARRAYAIATAFAATIEGPEADRIRRKASSLG